MRRKPPTPEQLEQRRARQDAEARKQFRSLQERDPEEALIREKQARVARFLATASRAHPRYAQALQEDRELADRWIELCERRRVERRQVKAPAA